MSGNNSVVECNLAKVDVASSNLVSRSKKFKEVRQCSDLFFYFLPAKIIVLLWNVLLPMFASACAEKIALNFLISHQP